MGAVDMAGTQDSLGYLLARERGIVCSAGIRGRRRLIGLPKPVVTAHADADPQPIRKKPQQVPWHRLSLRSIGPCGERNRNPKQPTHGDPQSQPPQSNRDALPHRIEYQREAIQHERPTGIAELRVAPNPPSCHARRNRDQRPYGREQHLGRIPARLAQAVVPKLAAISALAQARSNAGQDEICHHEQQQHPTLFSVHPHLKVPSCWSLMLAPRACSPPCCSGGWRSSSYTWPGAHWSRSCSPSCSPICLSRWWRRCRPACASAAAAPSRSCTSSSLWRWGRSSSSSALTLCSRPRSLGKWPRASRIESPAASSSSKWASSTDGAGKRSAASRSSSPSTKPKSHAGNSRC